MSTNHTQMAVFEVSFSYSGEGDVAAAYRNALHVAVGLATQE
jgi:hypothetical protein